MTLADETIRQALRSEESALEDRMLLREQPCPQPTPEELMPPPVISLKDCFLLLAEAEEAARQASEGVNDVLRLIVRCHGKMFTTEEGIIHQIRTRGGVPYMTTLKEAPAVYLRRARVAAAQKALGDMQEYSETTTALEASTVLLTDPVEVEAELAEDLLEDAVDDFVVLE